MTTKAIDKSPSIVLASPDMETIKRARRWIMGAARLLADASNGDSAIERIATEAACLAAVTDVVIADREQRLCVNCGAGFWGHNQDVCPSCFDARLLKLTEVR